MIEFERTIVERLLRHYYNEIAEVEGIQFSQEASPVVEQELIALDAKYATKIVKALQATRSVL